MKNQFCPIRRPTGWMMVFLLNFLVVGLTNQSTAHPMPNSVVLLNLHADRIDAEVQIPLVELQAAFGHAVNDSSASLIERLGPELRAYLMQHIRLVSPDGRAWAVKMGTLSVHETANEINGTYRELIAQIELLPPAGEDVRRFAFHYDAVLHQLVTHKILVSVRQDWEQGVVGDDSPTQVGVIELDIVNNRIFPLMVSLKSGSVWTGFGAMVRLGIRHIAEGTDHLLFLLVLLLPAPLLVAGKHWGRFGGVRYGFRRLLYIVTAFTLGHSLTLLLGALGWVRLPSQPVEILIAVSILVSAVHALRPLFPGKEAWVAAGFGLVHGLAFAGTLANLRLDAGPMALSILGFNLGIELMQLLVILLTIPWLMLLSRTSAYRFMRVLGAVVAALAAIGWMVERVSGVSNMLSESIALVAGYAPYTLGILAVMALYFTWKGRENKQRASS